MKTAVFLTIFVVSVLCLSTAAGHFSKAKLQCDLCRHVAEQPQHWIRRLERAGPHEERGILTVACHTYFHAERAKIVLDATRDGMMPNLRALNALLPHQSDVLHACDVFVGERHAHSILNAAKAAGATAHVAAASPKLLAAQECAHLCH